MSPPFLASDVAVPAVDVAVNETAVRLPDAAVRTFAPAEGPSVHEPTVAMPAASVTALAPATNPPPVVIENDTGCPAIGAPRWSRTITDGDGETAEPAMPLNVVDEFAESVVATGGAVPSPLQLMKPTRSSEETRRVAVTENLFT